MIKYLTFWHLCSTKVLYSVYSNPNIKCHPTVVKVYWQYKTWQRKDVDKLEQDMKRITTSQIILIPSFANIPNSSPKKINLGADDELRQSTPCQRKGITMKTITNAQSSSYRRGHLIVWIISSQLLRCYLLQCALLNSLLLSKYLPGPSNKYVYDTIIIIWVVFDVIVFYVIVFVLFLVSLFLFCFYIVGIKRPARAAQQVWNLVHTSVLTTLFCLLMLMSCPWWW